MTSDWQHATNAVESHAPQSPTMPALIKLTNLVHIPVSCIQTKTEVTLVLEEMHLGGFLHESQAVSQEFIDMLTRPMDTPDDPDNLHPVVYFLAALVRQPLPHVLQQLKFQSPISIIMRRVAQEPPGTSSTHRDRLVGVYADFGRLTGDNEFVGQLYDVAGGNEVLLATSLILCLLNAFLVMLGVRWTHSPDTTQDIEVDDPMVLSVVDNLDLDAPVTAPAAPSRWGSGWSLPRMAGFLGLYNSPKAATGSEAESRLSSVGALTGLHGPSEVKASPEALNLDLDCVDAKIRQQATEVNQLSSEIASVSQPTSLRSLHSEKQMQATEHCDQPGAWPIVKQHQDQIEHLPNQFMEQPAPPKHFETAQKSEPVKQTQPVEQTEAKQAECAERSEFVDPKLARPEPQLAEPESKLAEPESKLAEPEPKPTKPEQPTARDTTEDPVNQPRDIIPTVSHSKDAGPLSLVSLNIARPQNFKPNDGPGPSINDASLAADTGPSKKKKKKKKKAVKDELSEASKSPEPARDTSQADGGDEDAYEDRLDQKEIFDPQVVAMISEQLPHVPYDRLVKVLVANNFDLDALTPEVLGSDVNEILGASERGRLHLEQCLLFLTELFPKLEVGYLEYQLRANHGDLDRTCEAVTALTEGRPRPQSVKQAPSPPVWNKMTDDAARLQEWTGVLHATANSFLHKHKLKVFEALVDIIKHYRPHSARDAAASIPRGGRVQHGQAIVTARSTHRQAELVEYVYDANSEEAKELRAIYLGNKAFRENASEGFFERALVFYRGDYMRVVDIALLLNENGALELASALPAPPAPAKAIAAIPKAELASTQRLWSERARSRNAAPPSIANTPRVGGSGGVTTVKAVPAVRGTLDFHGYTVREAVSTLEKAVGVWWSEEVSSRHADGRLDKFGSMAQFVDPLTIITGRGLHSAAGVAKVRPAVIKWLSKKGFVFEELLLAVVVTGKRR